MQSNKHDNKKKIQVGRDPCKTAYRKNRLNKHQIPYSTVQKF